MISMSHKIAIHKSFPSHHHIHSLVKQSEEYQSAAKNQHIDRILYSLMLGQIQCSQPTTPSPTTPATPWAKVLLVATAATIAAEAIAWITIRTIQLVPPAATWWPLGGMGLLKSRMERLV